MSTQPVTLDMSTAQPISAAPVKLDMSTAQPLNAPNADGRSFMERAATQPSQFSHLNPLRYFDEVGQGMAQGAEMLAHPIDTAKALYKQVTTPDQGPTPDASPGQIADMLAQGYGQMATTAGAGKVASEIPVGSVLKRAALLGRTPEEAYQSALKPSTTIPPEKVDAMVQTGLKNQIPVTPGGVEKLGVLVDDLNQKIKDVIAQDPNRPINSRDVVSRLPQTAARFATQVNPQADLAAIKASRDEFLASNPGQIPAAQAQAMKQGTYQQLSSKAYGELKSASIEAQKSLARGLKEEIANQFPEIAGLNSAESRLYDLQPVLEKAVQRIGNHQLIGIGTPIATGAAKAVTGSNAVAAATGVLKAVLDNPGVKSRLAIALSKGAGIPPGAALERVSAYSAALAAASANKQAPDNQPSQSQP